MKCQTTVSVFAVVLSIFCLHSAASAQWRSEFILDRERILQLTGRDPRTTFYHRLTTRGKQTFLEVDIAYNNDGNRDIYRLEGDTLVPVFTQQLAQQRGIIGDYVVPRAYGESGLLVFSSQGVFGRTTTSYFVTDDSVTPLITDTPSGLRNEYYSFSRPAIVGDSAYFSATDSQPNRYTNYLVKANSSGYSLTDKAIWTDPLTGSKINPLLYSVADETTRYAFSWLLQDNALPQPILYKIVNDTAQRYITSDAFNRVFSSPFLLRPNRISATLEGNILIENRSSFTFGEPYTYYADIHGDFFEIAPLGTSVKGMNGESYTINSAWNAIIDGSQVIFATSIDINLVAHTALVSYYNGSYSLIRLFDDGEYVSDLQNAGNNSFFVNQYTPTIFASSYRYTLVPEPGTVVFATISGIGCLVFSRRRRLAVL